MNPLQKKDLLWFLGIVVFGTLLSSGLLFFFGSVIGRPRTPPVLRPDAITTSTTSLGNIFIEDKTGGYAIAIPRDWHLEKRSDSGVAVYAAPDAHAAYPCKIEISKLENPSRQNIKTWLREYLRSDPTSDIQESSLDPVTVAESPAIVWTGTLNGVSSTLAYVATGTVVYEFAPSAVAASGSGEAIGTACVDALGETLRTFEFLP
jgi:hypothetical protein